ncbi:MAG TPA: AgmX/PglI C-terminal domain-containing protein [Marinobacter sp.]|nr:AgmX/PglI C-terminal domain-containing protein [Marinobacter sp.]
MADQRRYNYQAAGLPWRAEAGENRRYGIMLALMLVLFLPPALLIPNLELPEIERSEAEKIPPQLARLIDRPEKQPEVVTPAPEPEPEAEPAVAEAPPEEPAPKVVQPQVKPQPVQPQSVTQAREKAANSGLLAMKDKLASLRKPERAPSRHLQANTGVGPMAINTTIIDADAALQGSGGVEDVAAPDTQVAVAEHRVKHVEVVSEPVRTAGTTRPAAPSAGERTMSNIRQVFDAQKTALYSLYQRELRQNPSLEGKLLLELVIEPDGSVSACRVVSSELKNPALEQRIAMRVRLFDFGADNVETRTVRFPVDFLPG